MGAGLPAINNPILTKELRTRMRGTRAFWILFAYLGLLSLILFITYMEWWRNQRGDMAGNVGAGAFTVGKTFYSVLFTVQAVLVGIITPALTAGGVSIEKEQRTFELLSVSLLPRRSIVVGKLVAAVAFISLLLVASLPLVSVGFLLGGVSPGEVFGACGLLIVTAFLYGACGLAASSVAKNTTSATVLTYGTIAALFFGSFPLSILAMPGYVGAPGAIGTRGVGLTALNPIGAIAAVTQKEMYFGLTLPAWLMAITINGLLGVILTLVAIHRLEYPRSDRSGLLRLLTAAFVALAGFALYGITLPGNGLSSNAFVSAAILTVSALIPLIPLFATGEGLPERGGLLSALDPRRLRRGEAPSGLTYTLLLVLLCGLVMYLGARFGPGAGQVGAFLPTLRRLLALTLAAGLFFGSLGLFLSALLRARWSALAVTLSLMVTVYFVPAVFYSARSANARLSEASALDNSFYLSPLLSAVEISSAGGKLPAKQPAWINPRLLLGGNAPLWQTSAWLYLALSVPLLAGAALADKRRAKHQVSRH